MVVQILKRFSGEKIVKSNEALIVGFQSYFGSQYSPRTINTFLYVNPIVRSWWRGEDIGSETVPWGGWGKKQRENDASVQPTESVPGDLSLFYMESQLEDFLIENWKRQSLVKSMISSKKMEKRSASSIEQALGRLISLLKIRKQNSSL